MSNFSQFFDPNQNYLSRASFEIQSDKDNLCPKLGITNTGSTFLAPGFSANQIFGPKTRFN
jgi:hypothetical protein